VAVGKITSHTPFKQVYVPAAGSDAGIAAGSALFVQHEMLKLPRQQASYSAFTGSQFDNASIKKILDTKGYAYTQLDDAALYAAVVNCIIDGGVVGWMSGRAEFGPRALGGRSIIADPRRADARDLINSKIKRRENFRPFAASILREYVADYFAIAEMEPFMERVLPIRKDKQAEIPAVTHVDGTGRLQTVDQEISPRYYALIEAFRKQTGVPILLNTSFNENEPIVNTPEQALDCFLRTDMDMLVLENIVLVKQ
jgi:carbamoyltransferase